MMIALAQIARHGAGVLHAAEHQGTVEILGAAVRRLRLRMPQQKKPFHSRCLRLANQA